MTVYKTLAAKSGLAAPYRHIGFMAYDHVVPGPGAGLVTPDWDVGDIILLAPFPRDFLIQANEAGLYIFTSPGMDPGSTLSVDFGVWDRAGTTKLVSILTGSDALQAGALPTPMNTTPGIQVGPINPLDDDPFFGFEVAVAATTPTDAAIGMTGKVWSGNRRNNSLGDLS